MWEVFLFAFNAIIPIILLIALGYFLKKKEFLNDNFLKIGNKFVFKICLPALLFYNVYSIDSFSSIKWDAVLYSEIAILLIFIIGLVLVKVFISEDKQKGVILQCIFRSNFAIIGIPLAESLGGDAGKGIAAILSAFSIPTFNILAVIALTIFIKEEGKRIDIKELLLKIVKNPLIQGVVLGLVVLGIRSFIPADENGKLYFSLKNDVTFIYTAIKNIGTIASPLALIVLGGTFDFSQVKGMFKQILFGTIARLVVVPGIVITLAIILSKYTELLNFDKTVYPALIALFGSPVAVSSAIMAHEMDNDGELAAQLVVWTSIGSILTIFIFVVILRSMALL